ncbi:MAG TPA: hypothetical protein VGX69_12555 [Solirubrobacteraceae bacterium]|jgi:hypothetical protein|nr:hypothetical protein [Solirubrobacteraceae bacterium]
MTAKHEPNVEQHDTIDQLQTDNEIPADATQWFDDAGNVVFLSDRTTIIVHPDGGVSKGSLRPARAKQSADGEPPRKPWRRFLLCA